MTSLSYAAPVIPPRSVRWPGPPLLGPLLELRRDQLATFERMGRTADVVSFRILHKRIHLLSHPDHLRHVLVEAPERYAKQTRGYQLLRRVVGQGLLTAEGEHWLKNRRIASPAFHKKRVETFSETMVRVAAESAEGWREPGIRDVAREMMRLTLRVVSLTLLSRDALSEADEVGEALTVGLKHIIHRMNTPWSAPHALPTPANLRFRRALATLDQVVVPLIAERRAGSAAAAAGCPYHAGKEGDLLDMLIASRDEEGNAMSDAQLRDEVMTILLAGHETTAMALTWTLWLLAKHPQVELALRREIDQVLEGRPPTEADLPRLALAERVIAESLRLYPPAWVVARSAISDDEVCGHPVRAGDWLFLSPWVIHRRPDLWPDPLRFDPDRFLPEAVASRPRHAWVPFSTGQRKCIGDQFALMEARLVLVTLLQRARFEALPGQTVEPEALVTLRPKGGLPLKVTPLPRQRAAVG